MKIASIKLDFTECPDFGTVKLILTEDQFNFIIDAVKLYDCEIEMDDVNFVEDFKKELVYYSNQFGKFLS